MSTGFKIALLKAGINQHELANKLGIHPATVSRIIAGVHVPSPEIQEAFLAALGGHSEGLEFGYRLKGDDELEVPRG